MFTQGQHHATLWCSLFTTKITAIDLELYYDGLFERLFYYFAIAIFCHSSASLPLWATSASIPTLLSLYLCLLLA